MNIRKSLAVLSVATGLLLGSRPADAAVYPDFTVDQTLISNCEVLIGTSCTLEADKLAGSYVEVLTVHSITGPGEGTFSTVAYFNVATFTTNDDLNTPVTSLLNTEFPPFVDGYDIFAVFGATGTFSTDFGDLLDPDDDLVTFTATSGCVELYVDRDNDSGIPPGSLPTDAPAAPACEGPPPGDGLGITFSAGAAADDSLLATATLASGEGHGFPADPDSGDFSLTFTPFELTALGLGVFIEPVPFYLTATIEGLFNAFTPVPGTIIVGGVANAFFERTVPEPASLTLLGMGLLGSAAAMRRRRQASRK